VERLIEFQRIDDPVAQEGIDVEPVIVGGEYFLFGGLDNQDAIVEKNDILDEGLFEMEPRRGDETAPGDRLAETQDDRLFGLVHRERRGHRDDQDEDEDGDPADCSRALHLRPPSLELGVSGPSGK
jgi:hypothetical protein